MPFKKNIILLFSAMLFISGCSSGSSSSESNNTTVTNSIAGVWELYVESENCYEYFRFFDDKTLEIESNEELVTGTYQFDETVISGQRHSLSLITLTDNGGADCEGDTTSEANYIFQLFVTFPNEDTVQLYADEQKGASFADMSRL